MSAALTRAEALVGAPIAVAPEGGGWRPAAELAADAAALGTALDAVVHELGCERLDVGAQRIAELWSWALTACPAVVVVGGERLPSLGPDAMLARIGDSSPVLPELALAAEPEPESAGLPELIAAVEAHAEPLVHSLNAVSRRPARALWRGIGDRLAGSLLHAGEVLDARERGERLAAEAMATSDRLGGRLQVERIDLDDGKAEPVQLRNGCCIYHRVPGQQPCITCPLLDDDERRARTVEWVTERDGVGS